MRTFTGYLIILLLIPVFIVLVVFSIRETEKVKSFHSFLDENINFQNTQLSQTSVILDRNGETVSELYKPMNRVYLPSHEIPPFLKQLFIVSEDRNFFQHPGFDLAAISRALAINHHASGIEQGASTITQQVARNLYLGHQQTYNRKLSEVLYAYQIERAYTKEQILELYLNAIYFQHGAYGIEAAAMSYFQKSASRLYESEQAFLAAIPNNPSLYDPLVHFERTKKRQERLLDQLQEANLISEEESRKWKQEPIKLQMKKRKDSFPDYVTYVESELKELIAENEKINPADQKQLEERFQEVFRKGVVIHTALDPTVQNRAVKAVQKHLPYKGVEGAAAVIQHHDHEIIAIAGGKTYKKFDFNRAYQAYRQPGSSIKPLLVYAPYLERSKASLTKKVNASSLCIRGYCPKNYGGANPGMVSLEKAFIHSYNTPAVRLLNSIGIEEGFHDLELFRFQKLVEADRRLPAAIGGLSYGMTVLEMAGAYTAFANDGAYSTPRAIRQVTDLSGKPLYQWTVKPVKIWSRETTDKIRHLMKKTVTSGTARQAYFNSLYIGGKTGTTNDYKDYWFIGLTEDYTAGVWVGKDQPESMKWLERESPQLLIWRDILK